MVAEQRHHLPSDSPARISPVSTKMQVRLVADRFMDQDRGDQTESTPPDKPPQITLPLPTWSRIFSTAAARKACMFPVVA